MTGGPRKPDETECAARAFALGSERVDPPVFSLYSIATVIIIISRVINN